MTIDTIPEPSPTWPRIARLIGAHYERRSNCFYFILLFWLSWFLTIGIPLLLFWMFGP